MKCNNGKSTAVIGLENIMQLIDLQRSHTTFRKENNDDDSSNRWRKKQRKYGFLLKIIH